MISQWPFLFAPTRRRRPRDFKDIITLRTPLSDIFKRLAISKVVTYGLLRMIVNTLRSVLSATLSATPLGSGRRPWRLCSPKQRQQLPDDNAGQHNHRQRK